MANILLAEDDDSLRRFLTRGLQRAGERIPGLRVLFITGFAAVALRVRRSGPDSKVLSKPFHPRDLVAEVDRILTP